MASHLFSTVSVGAGPFNFCESDDFVAACSRLSQVDVNMSSTLVELQAIALALECMPAVCSVNLFSNSQAALDACRSELNLIVSWHKVKGHSGILGNNHTDSIANAAFLSEWYLPSHVDGHFLLADGGVVSGNSRHFVQDVCHVVCHACWEIGSSSGFLASSLRSNVDWLSSSKIWHPDLYMVAGFTSRLTADTRTYLIKTLHHQLPVAVWKCIYNKCYPSVLCLYCGEVEVSDHVFSCVADDLACCQFMSTCALDLLVFSALYKGFAVTVFHDPKVAGVKITDFMCFLCSAFRNNIWLVHTKYHAFMKKNGLIPADRSIPIPVFGSVLRLLPGVVKLLGVTEAFGVFFGFRKSCSFFSDIGNMVSVNIIV
ncbi:hypothetical protein G9A89_017137 [Geosiphon pyriformis]|nr:hypothetical protein G9A89_017137 [Geosiphon pyriformis]